MHVVALIADRDIVISFNNRYAVASVVAITSEQA
jgi:hypothetical protein